MDNEWPDYIDPIVFFVSLAVTVIVFYIVMTNIPIPHECICNTCAVIPWYCGLLPIIPIILLATTFTTIYNIIIWIERRRLRRNVYEGGSDRGNS